VNTANADVRATQLRRLRTAGARLLRVAIIGVAAAAERPRRLRRSANAVVAHAGCIQLRVVVEHPLAHVPGQVRVSPTRVALGFRADVAGTIFDISAENVIRVQPLILRSRPGIFALLGAARRSVVPLGFGGQSPAIPNAESVGDVEAHTVGNLIQVATGCIGPGGARASEFGLQCG